MRHFVTVAYVPALLLAAFWVVVVLCMRADVRAAAEEETQRQQKREAEQQRVDAEFLQIVATRLADLEVRRPRDGQ